MPDKELWRQRNYPLITFVSTQEAMAGEELLKDLQIPCLIVPTPRELSEGCGLSLRVFPQDLLRSFNYLIDQGIHVQGFQWEESQSKWKFMEDKDGNNLFPWEEK